MSIVTYCRKATVYTSERDFLSDVEVRHLEGDTAVLFFPDDHLDDLWSNVFVTFYDTYNGLVTYQCTLSDYKREFMSQYEVYYTAFCHMDQLDDVLERRHDIKIYRDLTVIMHSIDDETKNEINVSVTIKNISAGGVFYISDTPFYIGQVVSFTFDRGSTPLQLEAEVLRTQDLDDSYRWGYIPKGKFPLMGYGCHFINMSRKHESILRSYVFKEDLNQRKEKQLS